MLPLVLLRSSTAHPVVREPGTITCAGRAPAGLGRFRKRLECVLVVVGSALEAPAARCCCRRPPPPTSPLPTLPCLLLPSCQLVELKNGETYNGHMVQCDTWMNIHLREVICTSKVRRGGSGWRQRRSPTAECCSPAHAYMAQATAAGCNTACRVGTHFDASTSCPLAPPAALPS